MDALLDRSGRSSYPQDILDRIYKLGSLGDQFRQLCYTSRIKKDFHSFAFFRNQILRQQNVMQTEIVGELHRHVGVYIENPSTARHNGMVAIVHPSKIFALFNLKLQRELTLNGLNSAECRETLQYLKKHVKIVDPAKFNLIFINCTISVDDLAAFVHDVDPSKRILRLQVLWNNVFLQGYAELLNNVCCSRIVLHILNGSYKTAASFNSFLNAVNRQHSQIYKLEIEYGHRYFDDETYASFVKRNIAFGGKMGMSVFRLPEPASKPTQLAQIYGSFNRKLAFYRLKRTNKWAWRDV
uniref:ARID domain-containing protein n=1 Tax=Panagrolaimus superbus TaxID=310955 RepID=A0A914XUA6_9BILA